MMCYSYSTVYCLCTTIKGLYECNVKKGGLFIFTFSLILLLSHSEIMKQMYIIWLAIYPASTKCFITFHIAFWLLLDHVAVTFKGKKIAKFAISIFKLSNYWNFEKWQVLNCNIVLLDKNKSFWKCRISIW